MSEDGAHSIRSVLNWVEGSAREGWFWRVDANHNTFISMLNTDTEEARVAIALDYQLAGESRSYRLPERTLAAKASSVVDVGEIIATGEPDAEGNVIPASVGFGGYQVRKLDVRAGQTVTTEALVFDRRSKNFLTFYNTCCGITPGSVGFFLPSFIGPPGFIGTAGAQGEDYCGGGTVGLPATFSSRNTSIATVNSAGSVSGVAPGSTSTNTLVSYFKQKTVDGCTNASQSNSAPTNVVKLSCTPVTVTRGSSITCTGTPSSATFTTWKFTSGSDVVNGPASGSSWSGTMVQSGTITVTATLGGATQELSSSITVSARSGFSVAASSATQKTAATIGCGITFPSPPSPGTELGAFCLNQPYSFTRTQLGGSGPNAGYWYTLSATNNATFDWAISADLANSASTFSVHQCGTYNVTSNPNGFISYANLLQNTNSHEAGSIDSHYTHYTAAQGLASNNVGVGIESAVKLNGSEANFDSYVAQQVNPRTGPILTGTQVQPCGGNVEKDSDAACRFEGNINYFLYQSCP